MSLVYASGKLLPFFPVPIYLGIKLNRSFAFRHHLETLRKQTSYPRHTSERQTGSGWSAGAKTLNTATLSLVCATAEYCTPFRCRRAHTRFINSVLNDALRIVTGCLRSTPTDHLPILSGIRSTELCCSGATLSFARCGTLDPDHILHGQLAGSPDVPQERLKSRRPFVPAARKLLNDLTELGMRAAQGTNYKWSAEYLNAHPYSMFLISGPILGPLDWGCQNILG